MKNFLPFLLGIVLASHTVAQSSHFCYTAEVMERYFEEHPSEKKVFDQLQEEAKVADQTAFKTNYRGFRTSAVTYTIPIVFHVLHLNGPENITDAQIQDAVKILNDDFRKRSYDTSQIYTDFKPIAADVNFEFVLAGKDPSGKCTNGITRHYDPNTNWTAGDFSKYTYTWPNSKYLNVYVVDNIPGAGGYTYLPGSVPGAADAIVIRHDYLGSFGTSNYIRARSLTHEVGHWFNLGHIWGMTNSAGVTCGDDGVSDTPITKGFGWCSSVNPSVCNPPIVENIQNYMDYAFCGCMFTVGQANRMTNSATSPVGGRNNLWSNSNLIATGVINPVGPCAPIPEFISNRGVICVGGNISFTDLSYNGSVSSWQWKFPGATSTLSAIQNPTVTFVSPGTQSVELKVSNAFGSDSLTKNIVTVLAGPGSGTILIPQSFETMVFPDNYWITKAPLYGAGWIQSFTVASTGNKCVMVDNYFDSPSGPAVFYTPMYDLTYLNNPGITFDVAHSQNGAGSNDRLTVYYSTDCAVSWTPLYNRSGAALHTLGSGTVSSGPFTSPTSSQWRKELVALGSSFSTVNEILFKFEFKPDSINPGNNIFIDDIEVENVTGVEELAQRHTVSVFPNPSCGNVNLEFNHRTNEPIKVMIFDLAGKPVLEENYTPVSASKKVILNLNVSGLSQGLYILNLKSGDLTLTAKLAVE
jgi:PKD repeat protein